MTTGIAAPPLRFGDPGYDEGRAAWNLAARQTPAVVVMAESAQDVQAAVRLARAERRGVGVLATGHGTRGALRRRRAGHPRLPPVAHPVHPRVPVRAELQRLRAGRRHDIGSPPRPARGGPSGAQLRPPSMRPTMRST